MAFYGNDGLPGQGRQISVGSKEAVDALNARPAEHDRRFRDAGWWPSTGTAVRAVLVIAAVIVALGWALTLMAK